MHMQLAVDQAIKEVCPIDGVSFGKLEDKSTWRIDFDQHATTDQKVSAQKVIDNFVWDENTKEKTRKNVRDNGHKDDLIYKKGYADHKKDNPNANFRDFMDYLESLN